MTVKEHEVIVRIHRRREPAVQSHGTAYPSRDLAHTSPGPIELMSSSPCCQPLSIASTMPCRKSVLAASFEPRTTLARYPMLCMPAGQDLPVAAPGEVACTVRSHALVPMSQCV